MKKTLSVILLSLIILNSCKDKKVNVVGNESPNEKKIIVFYPVTDSTNGLFVFLRKVVDDIVTDSLTNNKTVVTKIIYGKPQVDTLRDAAGKAVYDSSGIPQFREVPNAYYPVPDSLVITDISNIDVDILVSRKKYKEYRDSLKLKK